MNTDLFAAISRLCRTVRNVVTWLLCTFFLSLCVVLVLVALALRYGIQLPTF